MVDEYLSEREQADQLRRWLRENWIWLVAGVVLTLTGYYGYRWWEARQAARSAAAGERFSAMLEAISAGRREDGVKIAGEVTGEYADTPYADQATLVLVRLDVDAGDFAAAEERSSPGSRMDRRTRSCGLSRGCASRGCSLPRAVTTQRSRLSTPCRRRPLTPGCSSSGATCCWPRATRRERSITGERPMPRRPRSQAPPHSSTSELLKLKIDELGALPDAK